MTIRGITIQNFIANGIVLKGARNAVVEDNTIKNITSSSWGQAGMEISGNFTNSKILHNHIENIGYCGIELNAFPGQNIDNLTIDGNVILNTVTRVRDGGGIYVMDRSHSAKGPGSPTMLWPILGVTGASISMMRHQTFLLRTTSSMARAGGASRSMAATIILSRIIFST